MRRLYGFILTGEVLGEFCRSGRRSLSVTGPIPETAVFRQSHYDASRNAFVCYFEDESFDAIAEGGVFPVGPGPEIEIEIEYE